MSHMCSRELCQRNIAHENRKGGAGRAVPKFMPKVASDNVTLGNVASSLASKAAIVAGGAALAGATYARLVEHRSFSSWLIEQALWVRGTKLPARFSLPAAHSQSELNQALARVARKSSQKVASPRAIVGQPVTHVTVNGMDTFVWNDRHHKSQRVLLYLHGGTYLFQPSPMHYLAVARMAKRLDAKVVFPIYPKAPEHQWRETYEKLTKLYKLILAEHGSAEQFSIMGDSAGGGLALGFSMWLRDKQMPQPSHIVLISPWLDTHTNHPEIAKFERVDPMLQGDDLGRLALSWAGSREEMGNPYVSPKFGDFFGLGTITLITGTHEIFYPDIRDLHTRLQREHIAHHYIVGERMNHVYPIFPIPEARDVQNEIIRIVRGD